MQKFCHFALKIIDKWPKEGADENDYIDQIAKLLVKLKAGNFKVVASCDFEEDL